MTFYGLYRPFFNYFRPKRMRQFAQRFGLTSQTRVLDVGGYEFNWSLLPTPPRLTILNLSLPNVRAHNVTWLVGDGQYLPFKDKAFDVVYSNSVIEHLGSLEKQCRLAAECRRVGRRYYVQTPNRWFPIEPHMMTLFIHWLPRGFQIRLLRYFSVWGLVTKPTRQQCEDLLNELRLLDTQDLQQLFPGAEIWHEYVLGLPKSLMAAKTSA